MKCTGELKTINLDYVTRKPQITLEVEANAEDLEKLGGGKLSVELKPYREHRSLEANSYFYVLCGKIAEVLNQSVNYVHNFLLREYGQIELCDGKAVYIVWPDTDEGSKSADEIETFHIKPTSEVRLGNDGIVYRTYMLLRGSHDYDTKEMSRLIDGAISEAKELGIDTITPDEKRKMMEIYGKKHSAE